MSERSWLEERVGAMIAEYSDQAQTDVDPLEVARFAVASAGAPRRAWSVAHLVAVRGLVLAIVALAIAFSAGALVIGGALHDGELDVLPARRLAAPFIGLPPEDALPSTPETAELVQRFAGRVGSLGGDFYRMWVYSDGRLIWKSNLEGSARSKLEFGPGEPTTGVIEQRLTPEGVDLLSLDLSGDMLASSGRWLPESAWADRRALGFVPAYYAACLRPDTTTRTLDRLPDPVESIILDQGTVMADTGESRPTLRCFKITTEAARQIVAALTEAGIVGGPADAGLSYQVVQRPLPRAWDVQILPIVPSGEIVCSCG